MRCGFLISGCPVNLPRMKKKSNAPHLLDGGDLYCHDSFADKSRRKTFQGRCLAILQASEEAGTIRLEAEGPGLKKQSIEIACR